MAVVTTTLTIMGRDGHLLTGNLPAHARNLFKQGEPLALYKAALADLLPDHDAGAGALVFADEVMPVTIRAGAGPPDEQKRRGRSSMVR